MFLIVELQQLEPDPSEDSAVCPLDSVTFRCITTDGQLEWIDLGTSANNSVTYTEDSATSMTAAGIFDTMLTNTDVSVFTSTATVDSVKQEYNGRMIKCRDELGIANEVTKTLTVAGS